MRTNLISTLQWRLILIVLMFVGVASSMLAEEYITDIICLGAPQGKGKDLREEYRAKGWIVLNNDLNRRAGGWDVYIAYKTSSTADPEKGYITDIRASHSWDETMSIGFRDYRRAPRNDGFNGDMNEDAGGDDILIFYTRSRNSLSGYGGTKRVISSLSITNKADDGDSNTGVVTWDTGGACDMNENAGGDDIFIQQHFTTQTMKWKEEPTFSTDLTYNGEEQLLVAHNPWESNLPGKLKYKLGDGEWSSNVPKGLAVGNYTVSAYLDPSFTYWGYKPDPILKPGYYTQITSQFANDSRIISGTVTINPPVAKADNLMGVFNQADKKVLLSWDVGFIAGDYNDYKWMVYRNGEKIAELAPDVSSYSDTGYDNETATVYDVYYVSNFWDDTTQREDAKASVTVNTTRTVPVRNLMVDQLPDRIIFTWTSDAYREGFGNEFRIYVDDETKPIYTLTPANMQDSLRWEHRTTDQHNNRQDKVDPVTGVPYTEEPLNACEPHNYRIDGVIGDKVLNTGSTKLKAIGEATKFYSLDASKGIYEGMVKLSWHVNRQGSKQAKTYIVERRRAEQESETWEVLTRIASDEDYLFYTDETALPGVYYDYRITVEDKCDDGSILHSELANVGFAKSIGTLTGRISYGSTGTAVEGVDVVMNMTGSEGDQLEQFHSIYFTDMNGAVTWQYPSKTYAADIFSSGEFTAQMWLFPESFSESRIINLGNNVSLDMTASGQLTFSNGISTQSFDGIMLQKDSYNHVVLTRSNKTLTCYVLKVESNNNPKVQKATLMLDGDLNISDATQFELGHFKGLVDEFRLWTKCLTEADILDNYDHLLVGDENQLETYWTFDEGLQTQFFDYSRDGTNYRKHHGRIGSNAQASTLTPGMLKLKAKTDADGNYIIQGIPFSGEGTTYSVVPLYGVHEFNPGKVLRFVGKNALVHTADFEDVSSFPMRGHVYYAGTNVPVVGVQMLVDGMTQSIGGKVVMTDDNGLYEISVPIGRHYIEAKLAEHVMVDGGRWPTQGTFYFDRAVQHDYTDSTLVNFVGRISGGERNDTLGVGFGASRNNIGIAVVTLQLNNESFSFNCQDDHLTSATTDRIWQSDTIAIKSKTRTGTGYDEKYIQISTDSLTGEFSALLPPLKYRVRSIQMKSDKSDVEFTSLGEVDLTNMYADLTDSLMLYNDNGETVYEYYHYNTKMVKTWFAPPQVDLWQENGKGAFGEEQFKKYPVSMTDSLDIDDVWTRQTDGTVSYTYGFPIFARKKGYKFGLHGYEVYTNYDGEEVVSDTIPMNGQVLTIANEMSDEQDVVARIIDANATDLKPGDIYMLKTNQLRLDEDGYNEVSFTTGPPNVTAPYTRQFSLTYERNGRTYVGPAVNGIVLGELTNGNNFITEGPDHVDMVLRDPPGAKSKATWKTGTSNTTLNYETNGVYLDESAGVEMAWGVDVTTVVGEFAYLVSTKNASTSDTFGEKGSFSWLWKDDESFVYTTADNISTSTGSKYVGSAGDVFIGKSHNFIIGTCRKLGFHREAEGIVLGLKDAVSINDSIRTDFMYTALEIEQTMIPKILDTRNALLQYSDSLSAVSYQNTSENDVYLTWLKPSDEHYGEEGTYVWKPGTNGGWQDLVLHYTESIKTWKARLAENEQDKIEAINGTGYFKENRSFDGGIGYTYSERRDSTWTSTYTENYRAGIFNEVKTFCFVKEGWTFGANAFLKIDAGYTGNRTDGDSEKNYIELDYELNDGNPGTDFTVDIYRSPRGWGDIFVLRGGQSYNPYEGLEYARFYQEEKKHIISYGTEQMEQPVMRISTDGEISAESATLTDIPAGDTGQFTLHLTNNTTTNQSFTFVYNLTVQEGTNQNGLEIFMDGLTINGRSVYIPAGETVKKVITVRQTDQSVLDYEGIKLRFSSQYQPMKIYDEVTFSAHFIPSSSPIQLVITEPILNTENSSGELNIKLTNFDRQFRNLKDVGIQYRFSGNTQWVNLHTWVTNRADSIDSAYDILPGTGDLRLKVDMSSNLSYPEGTYEFRAFTTTPYGTDLVQVFSDVTTVIKDITRPRNITTPQPTNGILGYGDDMTVEFNEDIVPGYVTDKNVIVTTKLNNQPVQHEVALQLIPYGQTNRTENPVFLQGDFSLECWLKYQSSGVLLSQGRGNGMMSLGVNQNGQAVVSFCDNHFTSEASIPKDTWVFLALSFNSSDWTFSLLAEYEKTSVMLFDNQQANFPPENLIYYAEDKRFYLGCGITGAIHDMAIYNIYREASEASAKKYQSKDNYVYGLTNYWPMNEGHGTVAADSRQTHNFSVTDRWEINNTNYSLSLSETGGITADISRINTSLGDSYAIELWNTNSSKSSTIFETGTTPRNRLRLRRDESMDLWLDYGENSHMVAKYEDFPAPSSWHHLAFNVVRGQAASFYYNGIRTAVITEADVPPIQGAQMKLGEGISGSVDELRIWHAALTEKRLLGNMYNCIDTTDIYSRGLVAYYPFEKAGVVDGVNTKVATLENMAPGQPQQSVQYITSNPSLTNPLVLSGPPLKDAPVESRLMAKPIASERKVVINLLESSGINARDIEGTTLNITVDKIHDMHGNESEPIRWTAFVQRNALKWSKDSVTVIKQYGDNYYFDVDMINKGSNTEYYTLYNMPNWLTLVDALDGSPIETTGDLAPQSRKTLRFKVMPMVAVGYYDIIIGLQGNDEILEPLRVVMKVRGEAPAWSVNPDLYENSMSIVGQVYVNGALLSNNESILAAFVDEECRGIANIQPLRGAAYVAMSVYGTAQQNVNGVMNDLDKGKPVTFRIWDATTGVGYSNVNVTLPDGSAPSEVSVPFDPSVSYGNFDRPVIFAKSNFMEQELRLKSGWNWISLNVEPEDSKTSVVFKDITSWNVFIKDRSTGTHFCNGIYWDGTLSDMHANTMYKLNLNKLANSKELPTPLPVTGEPVKRSETKVTVKKNWNWIAYLPTTTMTLDVALAGANPQVGDQVKSQQGFAFYGRYGWEGNLDVMESGKGYLYFSTDNATKQFVYPATTSENTVMRSKMINRRLSNRSSVFSPVNPENYPDNMSIVVKLVKDDEIVTDAELAAFVDGECRGAATASENNGLYYLLIAGEGHGKPMEIRAAIDGTVVTVCEEMNFSSDAIIGTPWEPYVIDLSDMTGIQSFYGDMQDGLWYNVQGIPVGKEKPTAPGVYILRQNDKAIKLIKNKK